MKTTSLILLFVSILAVTSCATYETNTAPDIHSGMLAGSTFRDEQPAKKTAAIADDQNARLDAIKKSDKPFIFINSVPRAKSLKVVDVTSSENFFMAAFFGGILGSESGKLQSLLEKSIEGLARDPNKLVIINNVQIDVRTSGLLEYWNNYLGSMLFRYNSYNIVAEIAEISSDDLLDYLEGRDAGKVAAGSSTRADRIRLFRGIVHSISGKKVMIKSSRTENAVSGRVIIFLDRSGNEIGSGKVLFPYHTSVETSLIRGDLQKGYTAVIYGD